MIKLLPHPLFQDVKVASNEIETVRPPKTHVCTFTVGKDRGRMFVKTEQAMLERDFGGSHDILSQLPEVESTANVHEKYEADSTLTKQQYVQQESEVLNSTEKEKDVLTNLLPSACSSTYNHEQLMCQLYQQTKVEAAQKWEEKKRREEEQMRREEKHRKVKELIRKVKSFDEEIYSKENEIKKDWRPRAGKFSHFRIMLYYSVLDIFRGGVGALPP